MLFGFLTGNSLDGYLARMFKVKVRAVYFLHWFGFFLKNPVPIGFVSANT
jgi:hypothetical protein